MLGINHNQRIKINNKNIQLGCFTKKENAIKTRKEAEIKYFGNYRYQKKEIKNEF
jgi:hypothetical protein